MASPRTRQEMSWLFATAMAGHEMLTVDRFSERETVARSNAGRRRGFTLAEILVSVAIIAILAAAVIPTVYGRIRSARADGDIAELQALQNGILLFYRDVGRYPLRL